MRSRNLIKSHGGSWKRSVPKTLWSCIRNISLMMWAWRIGRTKSAKKRLWTCLIKSIKRTLKCKSNSLRSSPTSTWRDLLSLIWILCSRHTITLSAPSPSASHWNFWLSHSTTRFPERWLSQRSIISYSRLPFLSLSHRRRIIRALWRTQSSSFIFKLINREKTTSSNSYRTWLIRYAQSNLERKETSNLQFTSSSSWRPLAQILKLFKDKTNSLRHFSLLSVPSMTSTNSTSSIKWTKWYRRSWRTMYSTWSTLMSMKRVWKSNFCQLVPYGFIDGMANSTFRRKNICWRLLKESSNICNIQT